MEWIVVLYTHPRPRPSNMETNSPPKGGIAKGSVGRASKGNRGLLWALLGQVCVNDLPDQSRTGLHLSRAKMVKGLQFLAVKADGNGHEVSFLGAFLSEGRRSGVTTQDRGGSWVLCPLAKALPGFLGRVKRLDVGGGRGYGVPDVFPG